MPASTHPRRGAPRSSLTRVAALVTALGLALSLAACTDDAEPNASGSPTSTAPAQTLRSSEVGLQTRVTRVAGRLSEKRRTQVAKGIGRVVEAHLGEAYLREYPMRGPGAAFTDFTPGARSQARRDQGLLTGRGLKGAESVSVSHAAAYVALLAPGRHVVGATVRLEVDLRTETAVGVEKVRVRGRMMLTPTKKGWRVFGYDLTRSDLAVTKKSGKNKSGKNKSGKNKSGSKKSGSKKSGNKAAGTSSEGKS